MNFILADLVPVRVFLSNPEAEVARTALQAAGLHVVMRRDDCGGARPSLWLTGIALLVPREEAEVALAILDAPAMYSAHRLDDNC
jgi:hypothetical protein